MASYGRGIGNYGGRPDLGAGIGRGLSSLAERLRELEGQKIRANEIAGERAYETEQDTMRFQRGEESALARELRGTARDDVRFNREEQSDIAREQRGVDRETATRERDVGGLAAALRARSAPLFRGIGNADQAVDPRVYEDFAGVQGALASNNPAIMSAEYGAIGQRQAAERDRMADREDFSWELRERNRLTPRAPRQPNYQMIGGIPHILDGLTARPVTGPDGQPLAMPVNGGRPETEAQARRRAFGEMARAAATTLGDLAPGEGATLANTLGMTKPAFGEAQAARVPAFGNYLVGDTFRQRQAANLQLSDSWLRYTSGAAVPEEEVERFSRGFLPAAGDDPTTLAQKRAARKLIVDVLEGRISDVAGKAALRQQGHDSRYMDPMGPLSGQDDFASQLDREMENY